MALSPSVRGFKVTDYLVKILTWRNDLSQFFRDVTRLEPRPFQKEFFEEVQSMKSKNIVIVAGRGIGKTIALATVALWYVCVLSTTENRPFKVIILGGSLKQAKICYKYIMDFISELPFLQRQLAKEPTQQEIVFKDGSWIMPLPASQKSVRGHHPDLLIIDEAAEVDDEIIYAALPMTAPSPYARHIFSSTPSFTGLSWIEEKWTHQAKYKYPEWRFFNWNAESFLPPDQIEYLRSALPADRYMAEIQGLPYRREGKVFRLEDLKACLTTENPKEEDKPGTTYAGIDWGYCLPGDTEVLTKDGWRPMQDLRGTEEILTWNATLDRYEFQRLTSFSKTFSERYCEVWENKNLSIIGTWHHAIPCRDRNKKHLHEHELRDNLSHHYLVRRSHWSGNKPKEILGFRTEDFLSLLGWYLSEGSVECSSKGYRISIAQSDPLKRKMIIQLLTRMGLKPKEHKYTIRFNNKKLACYFKQLGLSRSKHIPKEIKELDAPLLKILFDTMMLGDGDKDGRRYNTYSKQLADDFQEICLKIGEKIPYIETRKNDKGYRVHLLSRDSCPNAKHHTVELVKGYFVALEVPNQYVLVRHNGKPVIVHNYPAPTALVIVKRSEDLWKVLYIESFLAENYEEMHRKIKEICESYNVTNIFTDSTDKGENLRLAAEGLPVTPVSFKGEKTVMLANLRMLIEQHKLRLDPLTQQALIGQLIDYVYDSKRNDDFVDALMLAVRANPITHTSRYSLEDIFEALVERRGTKSIPEDEERKSKIGRTLKEIGRI